MNTIPRFGDIQTGEKCPCNNILECAQCKISSVENSFASSDIQAMCAAEQDNKALKSVGGLSLRIDGALPGAWSRD